MNNFTCVICNKNGFSQTKRRIVCSYACKQKYKSLKRRNLKSPINCVICSKLFISNKKNLTCSIKCRKIKINNYYIKRSFTSTYKNRMKNYYNKNLNKLLERAKFNRNLKRSVKSKNCIICNQKFIPFKRSEYCSIDCKKQLRSINNKIKRSKKRHFLFIDLLNNPFPENINIEHHHINNLFVIPVPKDLHSKYYTCNRDKHRYKVNNILKKWGFLQGFEDIIQ